MSEVIIFPQRLKVRAEEHYVTIHITIDREGVLEYIVHGYKDIPEERKLLQKALREVLTLSESCDV